MSQSNTGPVSRLRIAALTLSARRSARTSSIRFGEPARPQTAWISRTAWLIAESSSLRILVRFCWLLWGWRSLVVETMPLNHRNELALGIGVAVDVPLRGLDRPMTGQQLHVAQRAACLMNNASGAGNERAAA